MAVPSMMALVRLAAAEISTMGSVLLDSPFQNAPNPACSARSTNPTTSAAG